MSVKHSIFKRKNKPNFFLKYTDPRTGKESRMSLGTPHRRQADQKSGAILRDIEQGEFDRQHRNPWRDFPKRYLEESTAGLTAGSVKDIISTLNKLETVCEPLTLQSIDEGMIEQFKAKILKAEAAAVRKMAKGRKVKGKITGTTTLAKHLRNLKRMLRWAQRHRFLTTIPSIDMPKGVNSRAKGRAITAEEFDRMIEKTGTIVGKKYATEWKLFLWGLFLSGLRLEEAVSLSWDYSEESISIDLMGRYPMFRIPTDVDKSRKSRLLPTTPDFVDMLLRAVPEEKRFGELFHPTVEKQYGDEPSLDTIGRTITAIGKAAGVKVSGRKYGSAHDLRRSFGLRWARKIRPHVLQKLMRHSDISTTMKYYVQTDAEDIAVELYSVRPEADEGVPSFSM